MLGMLSHMTDNNPLQSTSAASISADFANISRIYPQFAVNSESDLSALPQIIGSFDGLPQQLKSYLLLQLLRRCPLPTLQFISCLILPTLRRDFLGILPIELSTSILGFVQLYLIGRYLDLRSLGRCCSVSKGWKAVVEGPSAEVGVWKHRLSLEGWLDPVEVCFMLY
jgi:hypothetical protein